MKRSRPPARLEQAAFELIRTALGSRASVRWSTNGAAFDVEIELRSGQRIHAWLVPWIHGEEDVRRAPGTVWILTRALKRVHDELRNREESFVDLSGTVHLAFPNLLVDRERLPTPTRKPTPRRFFDPFSDRSSLVVRTLLESTRERLWGVRELAMAAGVVPATVSRIIRELEGYHVVDVRRVGRDSRIRLTDPHALFIRWTTAYDWTRNQRIAVHAAMGDPIRFLRRSKELFGRHRWALTLQAGASLVAPHATWERVHVYVDVETADQLVELADQQGWITAEEGKLVLMKPHYKDSVWHGMQVVDGLPIVSNLQLALDLWNYPLRGREQAEHLIDMLRLLQ